MNKAIKLSEIKRLTSRDIRFVAFALQLSEQEVIERTPQSVFDDLIGYYMACDEYLDGKLQRLLTLRCDRVIDRLEDHCEI